ncbi:ribosome-inactivating family protein [Streptomyces ramulosus]|uniref:Ribosome-inactivating family protein n=2 Tax=Streptomyces TaxID=1883 RepID=A0ABW1FQD5_9ACTN
MVPLTTLDLRNTEPQHFAAVINAIRTRVCDQSPEAVVEVQNAQGVTRRLYPMSHTHQINQAESMFSVRIVIEDGRYLDWYIQDTDLYGWGYTLDGNNTFYHLRIPEGRTGILAMAQQEGLAPQDTGLEERYATLVPDRAAVLPVGRSYLNHAVEQLLDNPGSDQYRRQVIVLLAEMLCEAARFARIAVDIANIWATGENLRQDRRDRMALAEISWHALSTNLIQARESETPLAETVLTRVFGSTAAALCMVLAILHLKQHGSGGPSRNRRAEYFTTGGVTAPRALYPVLNASGNMPDANKAWLFRLDTCLTYDIPTDSVTAGPQSIETVWPALKGTVFANSVDTAVVVPGSSSMVWLFCDSQYVRYDLSTHTLAVNPKEIYDGWPGLQGTTFDNCIDAAVQDPTGGNALFFFLGEEVLYYYVDNDKVVGPNLIGEYWPGLAGTPFARGVSGALTVKGQPDSLWLFRGDDYVRYDLKDQKILAGPKPIHAGWPPLAKKAFIDGVSAALPSRGENPDDVWLFHDDIYLRYDTVNDKITHPATAVADGWHHLDTQHFSDRIDAALTVPGESAQAWFFHDDLYLRYNITDDTVINGPSTLHDGWPGLRGTGFEDAGITAAVLRPGHPDEAWFFAGSQYLRYKISDDTLLQPPKSIAEGWPPLKGTAFANGIDAACTRPGGDDIWFFTGSIYCRYNPETDEITVGPKQISDGWTLGFPVS